MNSISSIYSIPAIFICGTDTGVGKTHVTRILLKQFNQEGLRAGGFKPFESGGVGDSAAIKNAAKMPEPLSVINPYNFKEPLAPGVAAEREGIRISFSKIEKQLKELQKKYRPLLIEGAGGLLVPVSGTKTNLDLIKYLKVPVVLVARLGLGTINHTLLTINELKRNKIKLIGVILNQTQRSQTMADTTNPKILKKMGVKILGIIPHRSL